MNIGHNSRVVAIVDDDKSVQHALQDLIESDGLSALCFGSAEQFLDSEARNETACLIVDLRMPGMSGLELQAKLKSERRRIPVIFITAHGDVKVRFHAMREGPVEFLTKPFNDQALLDVVNAALVGAEMPEQIHIDNAETPYASCEDFRRIFEEDLHGLYQLALLLTGDQQRAERCFVVGLEDCVKESRVFREWARTWAKRVIVKNAIHELHPQSSHSNSSARVPIVLCPNLQFSDPNGRFDTNAVSWLADFERFVFVLCVLERYREHECALLLGCSDAEVREARTRAIEQFANFRSGGSDQHSGRGAVRRG